MSNPKTYEHCPQPEPGPVQATQFFAEIKLHHPTKAEQKAIEPIQQGRPQEAEEIYQFLIGKDWHNHKPHGNPAALYGMQGKYEEMAEYARNAISIKLDYLPAYYNLGIAFQVKGELAKAICT